MKKNGFTMIELLIAAAIIGVLAVLSTSSYKNTLIKTRLEEGKTRTRVAADAAMRFQMDYPGHTFSGDKLIYMQSVGGCATSDTSPAQLIQCGYLENRPWSDGYFDIEICGAKKDGLCGDISKQAIKYVACFSGHAGGKLDRCAGKSKFLFCVDERESQHIGNNGCY